MNFDIGRLRRSDRVIGAGAIALFIFLFLFKWYGISTIPSEGSSGISVISTNGWHTYTDSRWIWIATIIVALAVVVLRTSQRALNIRVQQGVIVAGLGGLSATLIIFRIVRHPSGISGGEPFSAGIKIGIWLALIAAAAITYGGYLTMKSEGTTLSDVRAQASSAISGLAPIVDNGFAGAEDAIESPASPATASSGADPSGETPV
jgi:hypothetical protein